MRKYLSISLSALSIYLIINQNIYCQSPSFKTYTNPVIPGDHSDCTLTQVGNDFYTTGSSFNPTPVIYHSTDLIHWEAIAQPVSAAWSDYGDAPQGGCWGGQIVYYNNKWWNYFGRSFKMYFVTSDKPEGPWSEPVLMIVPPSVPGFGADNSIFIDTDNNWYLLVKNGQVNNWIVQLGNDGQPSGAIYNLSWLNPSPGFPYSWAEGPVLWKYNGIYYYAFALNVAGGQKVMQSNTLTDNKSAWTVPVDLFNENDPGKSKAIFSGPNHSSAAVLLKDSTSWVIHPVWARANSNEWYGQGRQGLVNQVHYEANDKVVADYPSNKSFTAPKLSSSGIPWMVPHSDFFTSDKLNPEWSLLGYTTSNLWSITDRPGWLRLRPKSATKANTIIKTDAEHNYTLITRLEFDAKKTTDEAGIRIINGNENKFIKVYSSLNSAGRKVICFSYDKFYFESDNNIGNTLWLKLVRTNHITTGFYSLDGYFWTQIGQGIDITLFDGSQPNYNGWCGNRQGLYVQGSSADFDLYIYRDAYTPILAECPANSYGTIRTAPIEGISLLDSIQNNDWALYAGVEFGNNDYLKASDSVQFVASSATEGGNIEVWLDSIDTGTKIATCPIANTGSWSTFKTFTVKTEKTTGRHDVYIKFNGAGTGKLFQLKWINFIPADPTRYVSSKTTNDAGALILKFNKPIKIPSTPLGFKVIVNDTSENPVAGISNIPGDSLAAMLTLKNLFNKDDLIKLSYSSGNIVSSDDKELIQFYDSLVLNSWPGSKPKITKVITSKGGDSLFVTFTKKMKSPGTAINEFVLITNKSIEMSVESGSLNDGDSAVFAIKLPSKIYYEDTMRIKYTGHDIKSYDEGVLNSFGSIPIINLSNGHPIELSTAKLFKAGKKYVILSLKFDRPFLKAENQKNFFTIKINGTPATISTCIATADSITLSFTPEVVLDDIVTLTYVGGTLKTRYNGSVKDYIDYEVLNPTSLKIESSNQNQITVFPNPVKDRITINSDHIFNEIKIYSILGEEVYKQKTSNTYSYTTSLSNLTNGLYIIAVIGENSIVVSKILVQ
jgi:xylan 1,4-beta-xylosidase